MKRSAKEKKADGVQAVDSGPDYSYGLRITLDHEELEKLGVKELPKPGEYISLVAQCCVQSVSQHESEDREDRSVSLQIEKMRLGGDGDGDDDDRPASKGDPEAKSLYSRYGKRDEKKD